MYLGIMSSRRILVSWAVRYWAVGYNGMYLSIMGSTVLGSRV